MKKTVRRPKMLGLLTRKERLVMDLYGRGYTTREIARRFGNTVKTTETHKHRAILKLRIKTKDYGKVAFKLAAGLIE